MGQFDLPSNLAAQDRDGGSAAMVLVLFVTLVVLAILGRVGSGPWARRTAARHLEAGAIGAAERSLDWADAFAGRDSRTDLMRAACLRRLGDMNAWHSTLESALRNGGSAATIDLERKLGNIRWGQVESVAWGDYNALVESGAAPGDAVHAVVHGLLAKGEREKAQKMIDAWAANAANAADDGEASFLRCLLVVGRQTGCGSSRIRSDAQPNAAARVGSREFGTAA